MSTRHAHPHTGDLWADEHGNAITISQVSYRRRWANIHITGWVKRVQLPFPATWTLTRPKQPPQVTDRSGCPAERHGDSTAYRHAGCRCRDALYDHWLASHKCPFRPEQRRSFVPAIGTQRRLRALARIGWTTSAIADRAGMSPARVGAWQSGRHRQISRASAARIAEVYEKLSGTPGPSRRVREYAARHGWVAPLMWEDLDIDNPEVQPHRDAPDPHPHAKIIEEDLRHLLGYGMTVERVAQHLGVQAPSLRTYLYRNRHQLQIPDRLLEVA